MGTEWAGLAAGREIGLAFARLGWMGIPFVFVG
jgi:hypothetical protein